MEQSPKETEDEVVRIPIDSSMFAIADEFLSRIVDDERREEYKNFIIKGREGALQYATWMLERVAGNGEALLGEDTEERLEKDQTHGLNQASSYITLTLAKIGGPSFVIPSKKLERENALGRAALEYAETTLEKFQEELELTGDPEKAAEAVGIRDVSLLSKLLEAKSRLPKGAIFGK